MEQNSLGEQSFDGRAKYVTVTDEKGSGVKEDPNRVKYVSQNKTPVINQSNKLLAQDQGSARSRIITQKKWTYNGQP